MARSTLRRIPPIKATLTPPLGSVAAGITKDGRQIWSRTTMRSRSVPKMEDGKQVWRKHPLTGEPLIPVREPEVFALTELFVMEDEGNGNVAMVPYRPDTVEELAAAERKHRIAKVQDQLAEALVDANLEPAELLAAIRAGKALEPVAPVVEATVHTEVPEVEYPVFLQPGKWRLSNGAVIEVKKRVDAEAAEQALQETKAAAALVPEV